MIQSYALALSRFHLTEDQFLDLTPIEFNLALEDSNEQNRAFEWVVKNFSELIRVSTFLLNNRLINLNRAWGSKESLVKSPEALLTFPWDKSQEIKATEPQSLKQMKSVLRSFSEIAKLKEDIEKSRKGKNVPLAPRHRRRRRRKEKEKRLRMMQRNG